MEKVIAALAVTWVVIYVTAIIGTIYVLYFVGP